MSFFEDASLVLIPSAQKTSKVYSVKPTDGTGDLTFTRSNDTASRVNSAGLIEKVRTNFVLRSEEQSNAQYTAVINEIASRVAVANPLTGQNNAYKITSTANNDPYIGQVVTGLSNGENTFSLWLWTDAGQSTEATLFFYNQTTSEVYTKAITLTTTPTRFNHTVNFSNIGSNATVRLDLRQTGPSIQYIYTYGWQAESGVATNYIATTSAAVSVGPVASVPRLDYLNSSCPRLLLEGQRSNLVTYSEAFNDASWAKTRCTVTANAGTSPDGYANADKLVEDSTNNSKFFAKSVTTVDSSSYTLSLFAKAAERNQVALVSRDKAGAFKTTVFGLTSGTIVSDQHTGTKIEDYGNGWYRCSVVFNSGTGATATTMYVQTALNGNLSYQGDGTSGILIYGAGWELGSYVTSYIPTLGAAVTRGADAASKTGISSLIGQTEGTLFTEVEFTKLTGLVPREWFIISDGTTSAATDWVTVSTSGASNNLLRARIAEAGVVKFDQQYTIPTTGTYKIAFAYKSGDCALYVNGASVGTVVTNSAFTLSLDQMITAFTSGTFQLGDGLSQALLFKTRLTNAQLAELTTI